MCILSGTKKWAEESYANIREGNNWRTYTVCDVRKEFVDHWLRTPFIEKKNAKRLYIEMTFTMRDCLEFPHTARTCKETFTLLYYESDFDFASPKEPAWSTDNYKRIERITADAGRFTSKDQVGTNVVIRSVPIEKNGVYFAFRDEGSCTSLLAIKVYYEVCEETVQNFAWFRETAAGSELTSIQETIGHCVDYASLPSGNEPKYVCKANGKWDLLSGGCQCNPGYKAYDNRCIACEPETFKDKPGIGTCEPCPEHSFSKEVGSASCDCHAGYYRAARDSKSMACTRPPSRPQSAKVVSFDQSSAVISWSKPASLGGRQELWYRLECRECPSSVQFSPASKKFNATTASVSGLEASSSYTIFIYAENDVSAFVSGLPMYAVVEVMTAAALTSAAVVNIRVDSVSENEISLSWDAPETAVSQVHHTSSSVSVYELELLRQHQVVQYYVVRYFVKGRPSANQSTVTTHENKIIVYGLSENTEYGFEVRAYTNKGWGSWSDTKWVKTATSNKASDLTSSEDSKPLIYVFTALGMAILFGGIVVALALYKPLSLPFCSKKKHSSDLDVLDYKADNFAAEYNSIDAFNRKDLPLSKRAFPFPCKSYVDPLVYEDPNRALKEITKEIDSSNVNLDEIIGEGEFGEVWKGKLFSGGSFVETVAIKTLKTGSSPKEKLDFLSEASIMGQFHHPNVVTLKGVVVKTEPTMIITEYLENGSLDKFLRMNQRKFEIVQLVSLLHGVASGMKYLSDKGYVHRDLAARNILVDTEMQCKIADFGLSRGLDGSSEQTYTTKGGKIPVRWTAPEAIAYRQFTSASDVWSYGVVMWEVLSYGERPYWDWTNQEVIQAVESGYRLPCPVGCPIVLYRLMLECCRKDRSCRPTFGCILETMNSFLSCPEILASATASPISSPLNISYCNGSDGSSSAYNVVSNDVLPTYSPYGLPPAPPRARLGPSSTSLDEFLRKLGLERHLATFQHYGIACTAALSSLTLADFAAMDIPRHDQETITDAVYRMHVASAGFRAPTKLKERPPFSVAGGTCPPPPPPPVGDRPLPAVAECQAAAVPSRLSPFCSLNRSCVVHSSVPASYQGNVGFFV